MKTLLVTALLAAAASSASGHEFWIKPAKFQIDPGATLDVQLFVGDGFPGEVVTRNGPKIIKFAAFSDAGELPIPGVNGKDPAGSITLEKAGAYVLAFRNHPSRVELEAPKFESYLREEGLDEIITKRAELGQSDKPGRELFSRCAKSIVRVGDATGSTAAGFDREIGLRFEIVPLTDPAAINPTSDTARVLKVKAIFDGKPLANRMVAARTPDDPRHVVKATTDTEGRAELKLTTPGMWLVSSVHMVAAPENSNADWESLWASVTFEVNAPKPDSTPKHDTGTNTAKPIGGMADTDEIPMLCGDQTPQTLNDMVPMHVTRTLGALADLTQRINTTITAAFSRSFGESKYRLAKTRRDEATATATVIAVRRD